MGSDVSRESFTVATGVSTTLSRLVEIILEIMHSDLKPEYRPAEGKVRSTVSKTLKFSNRKVETMLGWKPQVPVEEGVARLIRWRESIEKTAD